MAEVNRTANGDSNKTLKLIMEVETSFVQNAPTLSSEQLARGYYLCQMLRGVYDGYLELGWNKYFELGQNNRLSKRRIKK